MSIAGYSVVAPYSPTFAYIFYNCALIVFCRLKLINLCLVHRCDVKGCAGNLVLDGNFDNNRECCMAKKSGYLIYKSLPGEIPTGCMNTPQLGQRFCNLHHHDHQELDKHAVQVNLEDASKEFGGVLGPILRSAKKKEDGKQWAQVDRIMESKSLRNKKFYKVDICTLYFWKLP